MVSDQRSNRLHKGYSKDINPSSLLRLKNN